MAMRFAPFGRRCRACPVRVLTAALWLGPQLPVRGAPAALNVPLAPDAPASLEAEPNVEPPAVGGAPASPVAPEATWRGEEVGQRSSDARFIGMMVPHHQAAIAMAELARGRARRPEIRALAERIISGQRREIGLMRQWHRQWFGTELPTLPAWSVCPGLGPGYGPGMGMGPGPGGGGRSGLIG